MAASSEHDRLEGTAIVTLCPNVMGESAEGLLWGLQRTRIAEPWLTRNLVQKFKTRWGTQTSTCAREGHKGAMYICTLSLSLPMSLSLPSSSSPLTEVCLCSWNSDGELVQRKTEKQTEMITMDLFTCRNIPDKSAHLFRWYSKWVVYARLTVLISNSTTHDKIIHHPEYWKGKKTAPVQTTKQWAGRDVLCLSVLI